MKAKKQVANKTIEKKDAKLHELDEIIAQDVGPKLQKLKDDKAQYLEYQKVVREVDHLTRIHIAWKYKSAEKASRDLKNSLDAAAQGIEKKQNNIVDGEEEIARLAREIEVITTRIGEEEGSNLGRLEKELKAREKTEAELTAQLKAQKDTLSTEKNRKKQIEKNLKEDEQVLAQKEAEHGKTGGKFSSLKEAEAADAEAFAAAQRKYQAVSAGLLSSDDGADATLQDQLMAAKQAVSTASTEKKQSEMELENIRSDLAKKEKLLNENSKSYSKDLAALDKLDKEVADLAKELSQIQYEDGMSEKLEEQRDGLGKQIRNVQQKVTALESRYPQLTLKYTDPTPNFDRRKVKGLVCRMFRVKDPKFAQALESAAGGKLYFVITDNEETSKLILQRGQLQHRCTIIPINRITGKAMDARTVQLAQQVGGEGKVFAALDLIEFEPELRPAMEWVFGQVFICTDGDAASKVTYHKQILKRAVTLDGDVFDPSGTLSGGAAGNRSFILNVLEELRSNQDILLNNTEEIKKVEHKMRSVSGLAGKFKTLTQRHAMKSAQAEMLREQLKQTDQHQLTVDVKSLKERRDELMEKLKICDSTIKEGQQKAKSIEMKMKDAKAIREKELKAAQAEMDRLKKKAEESRALWRKHEQDFESANLEISELKSSIATSQKQLEEINELILNLTKEIEELSVKLEETKIAVKDMQEQVKAKKHDISVQNKEINAAQSRQDQIKKKLSEWELEIKRLKLDAEKLKNNAANSENMMEQLSRKYEWIEKDKNQFGARGGLYDFQETDPKEVEKRLAKLEENKEKLGRNVNTRAMNLLSKEEEQYTEVMRKKGIVEHDKEQLKNVIAELDEKKKTRLMEAWKQVNRDFGSIFSTLLPGSKAKLEPPSGMSVLDGLEVKVGFGNVWKESLNELSGGQRSLVALSLILAMLLFKPAPIYILDEVDAALDLSHTQNIGTMLKKHFHHSQFIVVSLKDGMFNNANVLFRTKFVDGMSTVTRTVQNHNRDESENRRVEKSKQKDARTNDAGNTFFDQSTLPNRTGQSGIQRNGATDQLSKRNTTDNGVNGSKQNGFRSHGMKNGHVNGTSQHDSDDADEGIDSSGSDEPPTNHVNNHQVKNKKFKRV